MARKNHAAHSKESIEITRPTERRNRLYTRLFSSVGHRCGLVCQDLYYQSGSLHFSPESVIDGVLFEPEAFDFLGPVTVDGLVSQPASYLPRLRWPT